MRPVENVLLLPGEIFFKLGCGESIGSWPHAKSPVGFGTIAVFDYTENRLLPQGESNEIVSHVGGRFHGRRAIRFKDVEENVVQTFEKFKLTASGPKQLLP